MDEHNYVVTDRFWRGRVLVINPPGLYMFRIRIIDGKEVPYQDYRTGLTLARDARDKGQRGVTGSAHNIGQVFPENPESRAVFLKYLLNFN
jgi:hypothetical protein